MLKASRICHRKGLDITFGFAGVVPLLVFRLLAWQFLTGIGLSFTISTRRWQNGRLQTTSPNIPNCVVLRVDTQELRAQLKSCLIILKFCCLSWWMLLEGRYKVVHWDIANQPFGVFAVPSLYTGGFSEVPALAAPPFVVASSAERYAIRHLISRPKVDYTYLFKYNRRHHTLDIDY